MAESAFHPASEIFPLLSDDELEQLAADIDEHGLREPIVRYKGRIIDGRNRFLACTRYGITPVYREFDGDESEILAHVMSVNLHRRHLTASQKAMAAARAREIFDRAAKERQREGQQSGGRGRKKNSVEILPPSLEAGKSRDLAGEAVGVSGKYVDRASRVLKDAIPEVVQAVDRGKLNINTAASLATQAPEVQRAELAMMTEGGRRRTPKPDFSGLAEHAESLDSLIGQKFRCIYADPPWRYGNQATRAATDNHYPTMTVDEIAALPVGELADEQCHLWLWTTNGFLFECPKILDAWGFEFKSSYIWVKPQMGIGNYLRNSHEMLLLAVRGGMTGLAKNVMSWGEYPRTAHSAKPEEIRRDVIEQISPGPRLELFGRKKVHGWMVWGNQIEQGIFDEVSA